MVLIRVLSFHAVPDAVLEGLICIAIIYIYHPSCR